MQRKTLYNERMLPKLAVGIVALGALATGGYFVVKEQATRTFSKAFEKQLAAGDYLAALAAAGELRKSGRTTAAVEEQVASAARLLVAEDTFKKAKIARDEKRFADASALLRGSDAITDPAFTNLEEAKKLYEEAEALAAGAAHRSAVTISALEARALEEKKKREETEAARKTLEGTLSEKEKTLVQTKAEVAETGRQLEASRKETEAKQAALLAEQARAKQLMEQVEKENKQKFINELRVYRDMAQKGKEQLDNAVTEINGKRDVTALIYVSQGKILFEEAKSKTADLRSNRTPSAYQARVDDLVNSLGQFLEASKQLRNAVIYIEEQGSAEFTAGFSKGKTALANAVSSLSNVSDLIAANP